MSTLVSLRPLLFRLQSEQPAVRRGTAVELFQHCFVRQWRFERQKSGLLAHLLASWTVEGWTICTLAGCSFDHHQSSLFHNHPRQTRQPAEKR
jgi:hypothetical protein